MTTRRYFQIGAAVCLFIGLASLVMFIIALWRPTDENRVDMFLRAYAWLYVGALHGLLAEPRSRPGQTAGGES